MGEADEEFIQGLKEGRCASQERFVRKFGPRLFAVLNGWTHNRADAEELLNETFYKALKQYEHYDPSLGSLLTWLCSIAYHVHLNWLKKNDGACFLGLEHAEEMQVAQDEEHGCGNEKARAFHQALGCLSVEERQILQLYCTSGRGSGEIAQWFGLNEGALRLQKYRAVKKLRARMQGMEAFRDLFAMSPVEETPVLTMEEKVEKVVAPVPRNAGLAVETAA